MATIQELEKKVLETKEYKRLDRLVSLMETKPSLATLIELQEAYAVLKATREYQAWQKQARKDLFNGSR